MNNIFTVNNFMQLGLNIFTIGTFMLTSMKMPEYGLVSGLVAQIFWFYVGYKSWKDGGQWGVLINTIIMTCIITYGVLNYWFL